MTDQSSCVARLLTLAEEAAPRLFARDAATWLGRLDAERSAFHDLLDREAARPAESDVLTRLTTALWRYWWQRADVDDGRRWIGAALARTEGPARRAPLLLGAGVLAFEAGDLRAARVGWAELLGIGRSLADPALEAHGLAGLGLVAHRLRDAERATALGEASLRRAAAASDAQPRIVALLVRGLVLLGHDAGAASARFEQAAALASAAQAPGLEAYALLGRARAAAAAADPSGARGLLAAARAAFEAQADRRGLALCGAPSPPGGPAPGADRAPP